MRRRQGAVDWGGGGGVERGGGGGMAPRSRGGDADEDGGARTCMLLKSEARWEDA